MQGQYPGNRGASRPGVQPSHAEAASARLFLCAGCRMQVVICAAATVARFTVPETAPIRPDAARFNAPGSATRTARRGDAATPRDKAAIGRATKKVAHHGSPPPRPDDLLALGSPVSASDASCPGGSAPANKHKLTGDISDISRSVGHAAR
jgi:hypothetical protein